MEVKDLAVSFQTYFGEVEAVRGVSFYVDRGETVALVGESGCGKSVTANSIMQLLPVPPAFYKRGQIFFEGEDLLQKSEKEMQKIRGNKISMIFQDPMTSLNPTMKVGKQIVEGIIKHQKLSKDEAKKKAIEMLDLVAVPQPEKRVNQYPHEFSGGMRQRVMIALAMVSNPELLIADEPTTALDVTVQAQILDLMKQIQRKYGTSIILITHDLGVVADMSDRVIELLKLVGLNEEHAQRFPHEFSGGQRQRIGIARALALNPKFIVCDEPISALDVSIQAQIVNLLKELQKDFGLTYLFIAHDLSMVRYISDRVGVMYLGHMMELATSEELYSEPIHPYTQALLSAIPIPDPEIQRNRQRIILEGDVPSPIDPKENCRFVDRCRFATDRCRMEIPEFREIKKDHFVACHRAEEILKGNIS